MAQEYTLAEVGKHNTMSDFWGVYEGEVYNVTSFLDSHPGGKDILEEYAGTFTSFYLFFHSIYSVIRKGFY